MPAHLDPTQYEPGRDPYRLYVLKPRKFHQAVLDEYSIYYSKTLKHFVTFQRLIAWNYPSAILRVVEFGDLTLDPRLPKFNIG